MNSKFDSSFVNYCSSPDWTTLVLFGGMRASNCTDRNINFRLLSVTHSCLCLGSLMSIKILQILTHFSRPKKLLKIVQKKQEFYQSVELWFIASVFLKPELYTNLNIVSSSLKNVPCELLINGVCFFMSLLFRLFLNWWVLILQKVTLKQGRWLL